MKHTLIHIPLFISLMLISYTMSIAPPSGGATGIPNMMDYLENVRTGTWEAHTQGINPSPSAGLTPYQLIRGECFHRDALTIADLITGLNAEFNVFLPYVSDVVDRVFEVMGHQMSVIPPHLSDQLDNSFLNIQNNATSLQHVLDTIRHGYANEEDVIAVMEHLLGNILREYCILAASLGWQDTFLNGGGPFAHIPGETYGEMINNLTQNFFDGAFWHWDFYPDLFQ